MNILIQSLEKAVALTHSPLFFCLCFCYLWTNLLQMIILMQNLEKAVSPQSFPPFFLPLLLLSVDESLADDPPPEHDDTHGQQDAHHHDTQPCHGGIMLHNAQ